MNEIQFSGAFRFRVRTSIFVLSFFAASLYFFLLSFFAAAPLFLTTLAAGKR
jgi:hypothetical protein